ncbi:hypothetical protein [Ciceribacter sp. RN22]|nr:hypothetical protein [Ciceribacter sp. RN22]MCO6181103.1 hypothetical protein [Ciceribacter sp. RN22]
MTSSTSRDFFAATRHDAVGVAMNSKKSVVVDTRRGGKHRPRRSDQHPPK